MNIKMWFSILSTSELAGVLYENTVSVVLGQGLGISSFNKVLQGILMYKVDYHWCKVVILKYPCPSNSLREMLKMQIPEPHPKHSDSMILQ